MPTNNGTTWLHEPCPTWCAREHREDDHPDDRRHQSTAAVLPLAVAASATPAHKSVVVEVAVHLDQPLDSAQCWVRIEATESAAPRLALTVDSAALLAHHLTEAVEQTDC